jgi:mitosis inhibitor protein kinase SWE1
VFVSGFDDVGEKSFTAEGGVDVDSFILRTLAAGSKAAQDGPKKIPGTPVKKSKTSHLAGERPWQSAAAANKVGLGFGSDFGAKGGKKGFMMPRKSLPAAFASLGQGKKGRVDISADDTDEEGEENSPSTRKEKGAYNGLGLGKPSVEGLPRTSWLMKRSSSGAFSSSSETSIGAVGTPTRTHGRGLWSGRISLRELY